jgi:hypothetical protein
MLALFSNTRTRPDFQTALKLADENKKDLELVKVELAERDVITVAKEREA